MSNRKLGTPVSSKRGKPLPSIPTLPLNLLTKKNGLDDLTNHSINKVITNSANTTHMNTLASEVEIRDNIDNKRP